MSYVLRMTRRDDRRRLTDRCRIFRPGTGRGPWNPDIGDYDPAPDVVVAAGRCAASVVDTSERVIEVGGSATTLRTMNVDLHYEVDGPLDLGLRFEIVKSANRHLTVAGRWWTIVDIADGSWSVARRLTVQEETSRG